jgi:hypothetical protein
VSEGRPAGRPVPPGTTDLRSLPGADITRLPIPGPVLVLSIVAPWSVAPGAIGEEPAKPIAKSIRIEQPKLGSLEDTLHIRKCSGSYELNAPARRISLAIDLYREGKKIDSHSFAVGDQEGAVSGEFSVQVIDLDFLPLGDGEKGHHRIQYALSLGRTRGALKWDVPKSVFEADGAFGNHAFRPEAGTATSTPLFPMILKTRRNSGISSGGSVEEVIERNKHSDILIAILVIEPLGDKR